MKFKVNSDRLRKEYISGKQTYSELQEKYKMSKPTIQKYLDQYKYKKEALSVPKTVLLIDTTYFGRKYGIMVFRSYELKKNLYWKEVKRETKQAYIDGIRYLESIGWEISTVVCDGKRDLLGGLGSLHNSNVPFSSI